MRIDCEFRYFEGDEIRKAIEGTMLKDNERIALEYFDEEICKWVCASIIPGGRRYRIRFETAYLGLGEVVE